MSLIPRVTSITNSGLDLLLKKKYAVVCLFYFYHFTSSSTPTVQTSCPLPAQPPLKTTAEILPNQVTSETRAVSTWHLLLCSFPFPTFPVLIHLKSDYFSFSDFSIFFSKQLSKQVAVRWCRDPGCNLATLDLTLSGKQGRLVFTRASASLLNYPPTPFQCIEDTKDDQF